MHKLAINITKQWLLEFQSSPNVPKPRATNSKPVVIKIGMWHAIRDIFVTSMNKGQLPLLLFGVGVIFVLRNLPSQAALDLLHGILDKLDKGDLVGWSLWLATSVAWAFIARKTRHAHIDEIQRIAKEKSELQAKLLGQDATSSKS